MGAHHGVSGTGAGGGRGTDTITLTPTSNGSKARVGAGGINTEDERDHAGAEHGPGVGFTPFPESDVNAVINLCPDVDWRAAVSVANGETSIDVSDILDLTNRGETKPKSNYGDGCAGRGRRHRRQVWRGVAVGGCDR
ncbi:MAG: hypothetical protein IPO91_34575 [Chloroflexi bacterium]|nr:hypothetical protein [Chloroflexota bacterium]